MFDRHNNRFESSVTNFEGPKLPKLTNSNIQDDLYDATKHLQNDLFKVHEAECSEKRKAVNKDMDKVLTNLRKIDLKSEILGRLH